MSGGGMMEAKVSFSGTTTPALQFEAGTPLPGAIVTLATAIGFVMEAGQGLTGQP